MNKISQFPYANNKPNIIIFPTDTVYGMGTLLYDKIGLDQIYQLKKRPINKDILVLCASLEQAQSLVEFSSVSLRLAARFWPGSLTLIMKTTPSYFQKTKVMSLGVRVPNHPLALQLLKKYGPLKTTSVNESKQPPLNDYHQIYQIYQQKVSFIYPNNYPMAQISSTIVKLTNAKSTILREGALDSSIIKHILKKL
ncbi:threonylcarbamoyl-AMP synthase ['Fragaria x ananassa' phyllody phytoplasma]|uniref:L-threonylcarbamoyladenylate synthase n=1 Tax='Fragaria x ananassa' phyllody phytoplasma TaxID=2358428 RepID=A0ABS5K4H6_9MOLU|nr:L-threonylcarbamoyladenylate synthase ['Fragaria x ananassa' phyllody phytoplasma]MBS2126125.1 threonylcarbamoyl-AMP synthase ['Fragaria x ananassa' phyllody phytoplasma]